MKIRIFEKDYSGMVLGASWGDLEASLEGFGLSWGCLETSWSGLGAVLGALRASRGGPVEACCCSLIFDRFLARFWTDLGVQKGPKMEPKRSPKRSKIEAKNKHENSLIFVGFREHHVFEQDEA